MAGDANCADLPFQCKQPARELLRSDCLQERLRFQATLGREVGGSEDGFTLIVALNSRTSVASSENDEFRTIAGSIDNIAFREGDYSDVNDADPVATWLGPIDGPLGVPTRPSSRSR